MRCFVATSLLSLLILSTPLMADGNVKFKCTNGTLVRHVEVVYPTPGATVPCSVEYTKDTEQPGEEPVTLWSAEQETNYCLEKAEGFVEKLGELGWTCERLTDESSGN